MAREARRVPGIVEGFVKEVQIECRSSLHERQEKTLIEREHVKA